MPPVWIVYVEEDDSVTLGVFTSEEKAVEAAEFYANDVMGEIGEWDDNQYRLVNSDAWFTVEEIALNDLLIV